MVAAWNADDVAAPGMGNRVEGIIVVVIPIGRMTLPCAPRPMLAEAMPPPTPRPEGAEPADACAPSSCSASDCDQVQGKSAPNSRCWDTGSLFSTYIYTKQK
jgi:hypothetical protein